MPQAGEIGSADEKAARHQHRHRRPRAQAPRPSIFEQRASTDPQSLREEMSQLLSAPSGSGAISPSTPPLPSSSTSSSLRTHFRNTAAEFMASLLPNFSSATSALADVLTVTTVGAAHNSSTPKPLPYYWRAKRHRGNSSSPIGGPLSPEAAFLYIDASSFSSITGGGGVGGGGKGSSSSSSSSGTSGSSSGGSGPIVGRMLGLCSGVALAVLMNRTPVVSSSALFGIEGVVGGSAAGLPSPSSQPISSDLRSPSIFSSPPPSSSSSVSASSSQLEVELEPWTSMAFLPPTSWAYSLEQYREEQFGGGGEPISTTPSTRTPMTTTETKISARKRLFGRGVLVDLPVGLSPSRDKTSSSAASASLSSRLSSSGSSSSSSRSSSSSSSPQLQKLPKGLVGAMACGLRLSPLASDAPCLAPFARLLKQQSGSDSSGSSNGGAGANATMISSLFSSLASSSNLFRGQCQTVSVHASSSSHDSFYLPLLLNLPVQHQQHHQAQPPISTLEGVLLEFEKGAGDSNGHDSSSSSVFDQHKRDGSTKALALLAGALFDPSRPLLQAMEAFEEKKVEEEEESEEEKEEEGEEGGAETYQSRSSDNDLLRVPPVPFKPDSPSSSSSGTLPTSIFSADVPSSSTPPPLSAETSSKLFAHTPSEESPDRSSDRPLPITPSPTTTTFATSMLTVHPSPAPRPTTNSALLKQSAANFFVVESGDNDDNGDDHRRRRKYSRRLLDTPADGGGNEDDAADATSSTDDSPPKEKPPPKVPNKTKKAQKRRVVVVSVFMDTKELRSSSFDTAASRQHQQHRYFQQHQQPRPDDQQKHQPLDFDEYQQRDQEQQSRTTQWRNRHRKHQDYSSGRQKTSAKAKAALAVGVADKALVQADQAAQALGLKKHSKNPSSSSHKQMGDSGGTDHANSTSSSGGDDDGGSDGGRGGGDGGGEIRHKSSLAASGGSDKRLERRAARLKFEAIRAARVAKQLQIKSLSSSSSSSPLPLSSSSTSRSSYIPNQHNKKLARGKNESVGDDDDHDGGGVGDKVGRGRGGGGGVHAVVDNDAGDEEDDDGDDDGDGDSDDGGGGGDLGSKAKDVRRSKFETTDSGSGSSRSSSRVYGGTFERSVMNFAVCAAAWAREAAVTTEAASFASPSSSSSSSLSSSSFGGDETGRSRVGSGQGGVDGTRGDSNVNDDDDDDNQDPALLILYVATDEADSLNHNHNLNNHKMAAENDGGGSFGASPKSHSSSSTTTNSRALSLLVAFLKTHLPTSAQVLTLDDFTEFLSSAQEKGVEEGRKKKQEGGEERHGNDVNANISRQSSSSNGGSSNDTNNYVAAAAAAVTNKAAAGRALQASPEVAKLSLLGRGRLCIGTQGSPESLLAASAWGWRSTTAATTTTTTSITTATFTTAAAGMTADLVMSSRTPSSFCEFVVELAPPSLQSSLPPMSPSSSSLSSSSSSSFSSSSGSNKCLAPSFLSGALKSAVSLSTSSKLQESKVHQTLNAAAGDAATSKKPIATFSRNTRSWPNEPWPNTTALVKDCPTQTNGGGGRVTSRRSMTKGVVRQAPPRCCFLAA